MAHYYPNSRNFNPPPPGRFAALNIPKCEHFTLLVCPLRFLVISAMRRLGNVQSFKTYVFRFWAFCHESDPARRVTPPWDVYMANCHPGWQGYPTWQTRQPALAGHPTYHVNVIKIKWEIIWKGGLPHLSGLPHLPGVPHLHVRACLIKFAVFCNNFNFAFGNMGCSTLY